MHGYYKVSFGRRINTAKTAKVRCEITQVSTSDTKKRYLWHNGRIPITWRWELFSNYRDRWCSGKPGLPIDSLR